MKHKAQVLYSMLETFFFILSHSLVTNSWNGCKLYLRYCETTALHLLKSCLTNSFQVASCLYSRQDILLSCGTWRFIVVVTRFWYWVLFPVIWINSIPSHHFLRIHLLLSSHLCPHFCSKFVLQNIVWIFHLPRCALFLSHLTSLIWSP